MEEKDARLEYLSWRVWHMKTRRRAHVVEEEDFTTSVVDDVEETSEDDEILAPEQQHAQRVERNDKFVQAARIGGIRMAKEMRERNEAVEMVIGRDVNEATWENREHDLYVVLISAHGLVRGFDMELGKDPDTGGQVKYVVEMAKAMAEHPAVGRVDLVTRLIEDPSVHSSYGVPEERLLNVGESRADLDTEDPEAGAFIIRLPFGNPKQYIRKEELWPHIPELADRTRDHIQRTLERLNRRPNVRPTKLHVVHGHYADASEAAALVSAALGVEMMMTGHSLGRNKLDHLLKTGASRTEVERQYAISRRIEAEERGLDHASIVFTSTEQEIVDQWGLYDGFDVNLEASLRRHRQGGRHMPRMHVIPPGLDFSAMDLSDVTPSRRNSVEEERMSPTSSPGLATSPPAKEHMMGHRRTPEVWNEITKFLRNPHKPVVLAMSRPDAKKNITTLVKAFGEHPLLREVANLVLVMGNRDDIENMVRAS
jgi:sucrose-phosphate synthase